MPDEAWKNSQTLVLLNKSHLKRLSKTSLKLSFYALAFIQSEV